MRLDASWACCVLLSASVLSVDACQPTPLPSEKMHASERALREWLEIYNHGTDRAVLQFITQRYGKDEPEERTPAEILAGIKVWRRNFGNLTIGEVREVSDQSAEVLVNMSAVRAPAVLYLDVDTSSARNIAGVWLSPFSGLSSAATSVITEPWQSLLHQFAQTLAEDRLFSGVILVAHDDSVMFERAYGAAAPEGHPITPQTRFEVASVSKLFTATAVLQLAERGILRLSDSVGSVFPAYPNVTVRDSVTWFQLLTHTAGIPDFYRSGHVRQLHGHSPDLEEYLSYVDTAAPRFQPGTRYVYSNSNYVLLAAMLQEMTGARFEDHVVKEVFAPAEMLNSCYVNLVSRP